jgi:HlyD family secretion protein
MKCRNGKKAHADRASRMLLLVGSAIAASAFVVVGSGCSHESAASPVESQKEPTVAVITPTHETIHRLIKQPGYIKSYEETPIYTKIAGFVEDVKVDIGDHVKKGELLAKLWVPEMVQELKLKEARVKQAKADLVQALEGQNAAEANVDTVKAQVVEADAGIRLVAAEVKRWDSEYVRSKKLFTQGVYDKQTVDEALHQVEASAANLEKVKAKLASMKAAAIESVAKRDKSKADVEAARAKVEVTEADAREYTAWLDYQNIRAPYDGVITERNIHTGHYVQSIEASTNKAARPLFDMVRMDLMRITIQVPEADAVLVKTGTPALITVQGLLGREISSKVTRCSWSLDEHARTLWVEVHIANPTEELRPGMYAYATLLGEVPNSLSVPSEALVDEGDRQYLLTVENGKVARTYVKVGYHTDKMVQLLKKQLRTDGKEGDWVNFKGNELIVARNPESLLDGQTVVTEKAEAPREASAMATKRP